MAHTQRQSRYELALMFAARLIQLYFGVPLVVRKGRLAVRQFERAEE
jgi:hypothetical protein